MSDIGMYWGFFSAALVLTLGLGLGLFWQVVRRREALASLQDGLTLLEHQRITNQQLTSGRGLSGRAD